MAVELILGPVVDATVSRVIVAASGQINLVWGWKDDLKRFRLILTMLGGVLQDADEKHISGHSYLQAWLEELQAVAHKADDMLEDVAYHNLRRQVAFQKSNWKKVSYLFTPSNHHPLVFRLRMANKVKNLNIHLAEICDWATRMGLQYKISNTRVPMPIVNQHNHSFLAPTDPSKVVGRREDVDKIVSWLTDDSSNQEDLSVFSVVGMPGLGKTTLVKAVCLTAKIQKYFGKNIMWVSVSVNFDVDRILGEMLESLTEASCTLKNRSTLLREISGGLEKKEKEGEKREEGEKEEERGGEEGGRGGEEGERGEKREEEGKSYLLILDDVWIEEPGKWDDLRDCLLSIRKNPGNRVVVTTRNEKVVSTMGTRKERMLHLGQLEGRECWDIIKERAFGNASVDKELEEIGKKIGEKCGGSPLVAAVLGGSLCNKRDRGDWVLVESKMGALSSLEDQFGRIMHALQFSFDQLPKLALKRCFAFCSIFPRAFVMKRDVLIQLWMAEGYLQASKGNSMEDVGTKYFNDLLSYSLFLEEERDDLGNVKSCKMHDSIHDFVNSVSKFETMIFDAGSGSNVSSSRFEVSIFDQVQHLNFIHGVPTNLGDVASKLCTLFSNHGFPCGMGATKFKRLRVLSFSDACDAKQLPTCFENSKSLRYLDISGTQMEELPKFITKLYNLQTFRFMNCKSLKMPPRGIGDLINLRHIVFNDEECMPANLGRLTNLQTLPLFFVGTTKGCKIEELGSLRGLKGRLEIYNLQLVEGKSEAEKAKLHEKAVEDLSLHWKIGCNQPNNEGVLEGLRPDSNLTRLWIDGYQGRKLASWMLTSSKELPLLNKLVELNIRYCSGITSLGVGDGAVLTSMPLKKLSIVGCSKLERFLVSGLSSLEELKIDNCLAINSIGDSLSSSACLKQLHLERCPNLQSIPSLEGLVSLKKVAVDYCNGLKYLSSGLSSCTALEELHIGNCSNLVSIPSLEGLVSLKKAVVDDCFRLEYLPGGLSSCTALEELQIRHCSFLVSIPSLEGLVSLKKIAVDDCNRLEYLQGGLSSCTALEELQIRHCSDLVSIPSLEGLVSLKKIAVDGCYRLEYLQGGLSSCTALEELQVHSCSNLVTIFEELKQLQSLVKLDIWQLGSMEVEELLLGNLSCLKTLQISYCNCTRLRCLSGGLSSLEQLEIRGCSNLVSFQGELKELHYVTIVGCPKFVSFPEENLGCCTRLKRLRLALASGDWPASPNSRQEFPNLSSTSTSLEVLRLKGWGESQTLPHQIQRLTVLRDLTIKGFNGVEEAFLGNLSCLKTLKIRDCTRLRSVLPGLSSLEELKITECPNLVSFQGELKELHSLTIGNCPKMVGFVEESLSCCTRLKRLEIGLFSEELEGFPSLSSIHASLERLDLYGWKKLTHLPEIQHLTALKELRIYSFGGMESLPNWFNNLSSLQLLYIDRYCSDELKKRCERSGADWHKISHVPYIRIARRTIQSKD
ncbi:hypothetical protein SLA2020_436580 [Shorea laevis]